MKSVLKYLLLAFVAIAVLMMVGKQVPDRPDNSSIQQPVAVALPSDGAVAIYFHGNIRCPTCQKIEAYAREAIDANFSNELDSGSLSWQVLNYEEADNGQFVTRYEIAAPTVVLVKREENRDVQWRNLSRVWELVGDKPAFLDYVATETKTLLTVK